MTDIHEELRRLDEALGGYETGGTESFGVELMRESLESQREHLLAQLTDQQLALGLTRSNRRGTGGELKLVASVLAALQDSLASIAQGFVGRQTTRGLIPAAVVESVELRVQAASPGSLNLVLIPSFPDTQTPLFDDGAESPLDLSVLRLSEVLSRAVGPPEALLQSVSDIGPRATGHIASLAKALSDSDASMTMAWQSPRHHEVVELNTDAAASLQRTLAEVEERQRTVVFTGRLVGGSLVRATFELELEDQSIVRGSVDEGVLPQLEELFGSPCTATLDVREVRLSGGETKESHRLTSLGA